MPILVPYGPPTEIARLVHLFHLLAATLCHGRVTAAHQRPLDMLPAGRKSACRAQGLGCSAQLLILNTVCFFCCSSQGSFIPTPANKSHQPCIDLSSASIHSGASFPKPVDCLVPGSIQVQSPARPLFKGLLLKPDSGRHWRTWCTVTEAL